MSPSCVHFSHLARNAKPLSSRLGDPFRVRPKHTNDKRLLPSPQIPQSSFIIFINPIGSSDHMAREKGEPTDSSRPMNVPGSLRYVAYIVDGGRFSFTVDRSHGLNNPGGSQRESDSISTSRAARDAKRRCRRMHIPGFLRYVAYIVWRSPQLHRGSLPWVEQPWR